MLEQSIISTWADIFLFDISSLLSWEASDMPWINNIIPRGDKHIVQLKIKAGIQGGEKKVQFTTKF